MTVKSARHQTALDYAKAGIPIFPCRVNGKEPATSRGFYDATTDIDQINAWWATNDWNIGMVPESAGWAVVDIDDLNSWETFTANEQIPETYTVETPSGGRHLYFCGSLPSSAGRLAPGIDTRGRGGYVLVPPSQVAGVAYQLYNDTAPARIPPFILERLNVTERLRAEAPDYVLWDLPETIQFAKDLIERDVAKYGQPTEGKASDDRTFKFINTVLDGTYGKSLNPETAIDLLHEHWAPHFDREWLEAKMDSALKPDRQSPRQNAFGCGQAGSPERRPTPEAWAQYVETNPAPEPPPMPLFRPWPTIKNAYFEPPQWVWKDRLLAYEPNLYTGDAGVGKTTLAENIAVAVACGIDLLGQSINRPQPVAILCAEDHYGPVRDNLAAIAQAVGATEHPGLDQIHILSVKSDRVPGGHVLTRISDDGTRRDTPFMTELVAPFLRSFDGEVLWIMDPLAEFVAFNNLADQACRALATNFLADVCSMNGGRVTALVNDHPSKASMANNQHYAGSVQLKAAFSFFATLIGGKWSGTVNKQRKLSFVVQKGRYAAEDSIEFYRTSTSPAFTIGGLPGHDPKTLALRVYWHIVDRLEQDQRTGKTNALSHGPREVATILGMQEEEVSAAMNYARREGWLVYIDSKESRTPGWEHGHNRQGRGDEDEDEEY